MRRLQHCYYNTRLCYCKWYIYLLHCTVRSTLGFQVFNVCGILVTKSNVNSSHSLIKSYSQCPYIIACLSPAFTIFNNVLVSVPKCRCCHFLTTVSVMSQCPVLSSILILYVDAAIFLTSASVMTQQSLALPKWRCCHVVNICIGDDDSTVFCCSDMEMFHTGFIHCLSVQSSKLMIYMSIHQTNIL